MPGTAYRAVTALLPRLGRVSADARVHHRRRPTTATRRSPITDRVRRSRPRAGRLAPLAVSGRRCRGLRAPTTLADRMSATPNAQDSIAGPSVSSAVALPATIASVSATGSGAGGPPRALCADGLVCFGRRRRGRFGLESSATVRLLVRVRHSRPPATRPRTSAPRPFQGGGGSGENTAAAGRGANCARQGPGGPQHGAIDRTRGLSRRRAGRGSRARHRPEARVSCSCQQSRRSISTPPGSPSATGPRRSVARAQDRRPHDAHDARRRVRARGRPQRHDHQRAALPPPHARSDRMRAL